MPVPDKASVGAEYAFRFAVAYPAFSIAAFTVFQACDSSFPTT